MEYMTKPKSSAQLLWERLESIRSRECDIPEDWKQVYQWAMQLKTNSRTVSEMLVFGVKKGLVEKKYFTVYVNSRFRQRLHYRLLTEPQNLIPPKT